MKRDMSGGAAETDVRAKKSPRFRRCAVRIAVVSSATLAGLAIIGDWAGFGWVSGPAAIGAIGAMFLAFVLSSLPVATDERGMGDHVPLPSRSAGNDGD